MLQQNKTDIVLTRYSAQWKLINPIFFSGNFAVKGKSRGSWLLSNLYQCLKLYARSPDELETIDFLRILTEVLQCMSHEMFGPKKDSKYSHLAGQFSPGCFTHCLTKHVYFTRKESKRKGIKNYFSCLLPEWNKKNYFPVQISTFPLKIGKEAKLSQVVWGHALKYLIQNPAFWAYLKGFLMFENKHIFLTLFYCL